MQFYTYQEVLDESIKYFNGDELAASVFVDKYCLKDNDGNFLEKNPRDMHRRIAKEFARIEKNKFKNPLTEDEIFDLLDNFKYLIPGGSPMFGIGNRYSVVSLSNCFVIPSPEDSYGGILKTDEEIIQISKRRGGVGVDVSTIRPNGSKVKNAAKTSTGVVSFCSRFSNSIREVGQSGRRGALMERIDIKHPDSINIPDDNDKCWTHPEKIILKGNPEKGERDIETLSCYYNPNNIDFASMKLDRKMVTGANVSIGLSDDFMNCVKNNQIFTQQFPIDSQNPSIKKQINARKAWQKIIHMAWQSAEPGLFFWDRVTKYNAVDCYKEFKSIVSNPCGEIPLCPFDSCRLMCLNLYSFVDNPFSKSPKFNFDLFKSLTQKSQRLMDDLIDLEIEKIDLILQKIQSDPESLDIKQREINIWKNIKDKAINGRRTGLGITALADMFAALNIKYDSLEAIQFADNVFKTFKLAAFQSSNDIAKEIGAFPIWNWEIEKNSEFLLQIKNESPELYENISKYGRRNIGLLTIAPTGSISIETQTSSGCEPVFALSYSRRKKIDADSKEKSDFVDEKGDKWQTFKVYHSKLQKWMDITGENDVTKSPYYNCCASDINWNNRVKLQGVLQKHIDHSISSTINLPYTITEQEVADIYMKAWEFGLKGVTVYREGCRSGVMVKESDNSKKLKISFTDAPKRPKDLSAEIFSVSYKKQKFYIAVGFLDGEIYEVFAGPNNGDFRNSKGKIHKLSRGKYVFIYDDKKEYQLTQVKDNEFIDIICRLVSTGLRHGTSLSFIVEQLEKSEGDLSSFSKVLARVIKHYIKDGTKVHGEKCPNCGSDIIRQNGCRECRQCSWSACS